MRRTILTATLLLLAACGTPAPPSDLTAHFARTDGKPFLVEAAANGDTRIIAGNETYLHVGGTDYIVMGDGRGAFVAREDDLLALLTETAGAARPQPDYIATEAGTESVAGLPGRLWRVHPKDIPSLTSIDAVVSTDPALAGAGKGLAAYVRALIVRNVSARGAPGKLEAAMIALAEKGTVLRYGQVFRLEHVDKAPLPKGIFALPSPALDKAALKRRLEPREMPII